MANENLIQTKYSEKLHRGIILEINSDYLHVLNEQCEHIKIHFKSGHKVGDQIYFTDENRVNLGMNKGLGSRSSLSKKVRYLSGLAAVILIAFLINSTFFDVTYAVMSLDINPSLELALNKTGEVIKVLPLNEDAKRLVSTLDLKSQSYEVAVAKILEQAVLEGYSIDQKSVLIAVAPTQSDSDQMVEAIEKNMTLYTETLGAEVMIGNQQSYEEIRNKEISLGRHLFSAEHPDYDEADVKNLEIHDLFKRIKQEDHEHDTELDEHEIESDGHEDESTTEVYEHEDDPKGEHEEEHEDEEHEDEDPGEGHDD